MMNKRSQNLLFNGEGKVIEVHLNERGAGYIENPGLSPTVYLYSGRFAYGPCMELIGLGGVSINTPVIYTSNKRFELDLAEAIEMSRVIKSVIKCLFQYETYRFTFGSESILLTPHDLLSDFMNVRGLVSIHDDQDMLVWSKVSGWEGEAYHDLVTKFVEIIDANAVIDSQFTDSAIDDGLNVIDAANSYLKGHGDIDFTIIANDRRVIDVMTLGHPRISKLVFSCNASPRNNAVDCYFDDGKKCLLVLKTDAVSLIMDTDKESLLDF
jgi:hypothetical protein